MFVCVVCVCAYLDVFGDPSTCLHAQDTEGTGYRNFQEHCYSESSMVMGLSKSESNSDMVCHVFIHLPLSFPSPLHASKYDITFIKRTEHWIVSYTFFFHFVTILTTCFIGGTGISILLVKLPTPLVWVFLN